MNTPNRAPSASVTAAENAVSAATNLSARDMSDLRHTRRPTPPLDPVLSGADWGWTAGVFEGEGCNRLDKTCRGNAGGFLVVLLGNTDETIPRWFFERWGGSLKPRVNRQPNHRPSWTWQLTTRKALVF